MLGLGVGQASAVRGSRPVCADAAGVGVCRQDACSQPADAAAQQTVSEPEQPVTTAWSGVVAVIAQKFFKARQNAGSVSARLLRAVVLFDSAQLSSM